MASRRPATRVKASEIRALEAQYGTQKALAEHLGVSARYLRYLKRGERRGEKLSKTIHREYAAAAREARVSVRAPARVRDFFRREVWVSEPSKAEQAAPIPIYPPSTGKPGERYMVWAKVFVPRKDISGGKGKHRGKAGVWRNEFAGYKTAAEFKRDQMTMREDVKANLKKAFGVRPTSIKFFRGGRGV